MQKITITIEIFDKAAWNPADRDGMPAEIMLDEDDLMAIATLRGYKRGVYGLSIKQVTMTEEYKK